jgi:hypothetical protein
VVNTSQGLHKGGEKERKQEEIKRNARDNPKSHTQQNPLQHVLKNCTWHLGLEADLRVNWKY